MFAGNTVVALKQGYVTVLADRHQFAFLHDKWLLGQVAEEVFLSAEEHVTARQLTAGHRLLVEVVQRYVDSRIQLIQRSEHHPLDVKIDGSVQKLDRVLDKCLVLWMAYTRRVYGTSIMFGKGGKLLVDYQGNRIGIYKNYKDLGIIKSTWS